MTMLELAPSRRRRMSKHARAAGLAVALAALAPALAGAGELDVDVEAGAVTASRNDARIPGDGGTRLSLVEDLSSSPEPVFRVRLGYRLADRHLVSALYAPLTLTASGTLEQDTAFAGRSFSAGDPVLALYRFDSYRLTYRYSVVRNRVWEIAGGLTGKIRDAEISVQGDGTATKTNTGFVPLVNVHVAWQPGGGRFGLVLDADALAAPQGRAADVLLAATWAVRDGVTLRAGYRTVEGGADNDEVYNFAWLHYGVAGLALSF